MREIKDKDVKTLAIVLKRINYGEADRILTLITPSGKFSAIAKGVRKPKSKLAGGVEMFSLAELNLHEGKTELYTVTGAKMIEHYSNLVKDLARMEVASEILKKINRESETGVGDYFEIARACLEELNKATDVTFVRDWFVLNETNVAEEINLYRDADGNKLSAEKKYDWSVKDKAFYESVQGSFGANEIKMLRLMVTMDLEMLKRVKADAMVLAKVSQFTQMMV